MNHNIIASLIQISGFSIRRDSRQIFDTETTHYNSNSQYTIYTPIEILKRDFNASLPIPEKTTLPYFSCLFFTLDALYTI